QPHRRLAPQHLVRVPRGHPGPAGSAPRDCRRLRLSGKDRKIVAVTAQRLVYRFEEADPDNAILFGGKGAGLARMTTGGLPVPPGFVITTEACLRYNLSPRGTPPDPRGSRPPAELLDEAMEHLADLEAATGRCFGGGP